MTDFVANGDLDLFDQFRSIPADLLEVLLEENHAGDVFRLLRDLRLGAGNADVEPQDLRRSILVAEEVHRREVVDEDGNLGDVFADRTRQVVEGRRGCFAEIDFVDLLGQVNPQSSSAVLLNPDKFIFEPTDAELAEFIAFSENGDQFSDISAEDIGVLVDRRQANTDEATLKGYDFGVRYMHDTSFGLMNYGLSGNYQDEFELTQNGTAVDQLEYNPDLFVTANIGWSGYNARASLTFRYTSEFDADPSIAVNQDDVDDFLTTNLFLGYDFGGSSEMLEGLSLRFNVDNVLDEDPPEYRSQRGLNYPDSAWSLGRVYKLGLSYRF